MALKVLGQSNPAATTNTTVYTVAAGKSTVVSSLVVCNQSSSTPVTFRIYVVPGGGAPAAVNYIVYDATLQPNETAAFTLGISMTATDIVGVYASTTSLSISAFGDES